MTTLVYLHTSYLLNTRPCPGCWRVSGEQDPEKIFIFIRGWANKEKEKVTAVVSAAGTPPAEWGKQSEGGVGRGGISQRGHLSAKLKGRAQSSTALSYTSPHRFLTVRLLTTEASEVDKAFRFPGPRTSKNNSNLSLIPF